MYEINFYQGINPKKKQTLQAGIEFKKNLRVRFGNYGGLKLEYFWVVKSKKAKSFIRGFMMNDFAFLFFTTQKYSSFNPPYFPKRTLKFFLDSITACSERIINFSVARLT